MMVEAFGVALIAIVIVVGYVALMCAIFGEPTPAARVTGADQGAALTDDEREALDPDALTVCIEHGTFIPCRKRGDHYYSQNPYWVKAVRDYQHSTIDGLTWEPASDYAARIAREGGDR